MEKKKLVIPCIDCQIGIFKCNADGLYPSCASYKIFLKRKKEEWEKEENGKK